MSVYGQHAHTRIDNKNKQSARASRNDGTTERKARQGKSPWAKGTLIKVDVEVLALCAACDISQ